MTVHVLADNNALDPTAVSVSVLMRFDFTEFFSYLGRAVPAVGQLGLGCAMKRLFSILLLLFTGSQSVREDAGTDNPPMSAKDVFLAYIRAYNAKDVSAMLAYFDETRVFENISGGKVTVRTEGKAELEALARKSVQAFASRKQKLLSLTEGQGRIVAEIEYHAVLQADFSLELKAGSQLDLRGVTVCEFAGGKIVRLSDYS